MIRLRSTISTSAGLCLLAGLVAVTLPTLLLGTLRTRRMVDKRRAHR